MKVNLCGLRRLYPQVIAVTQQTIGNLLFFKTMMTAALTLLLVSTALIASAVRHVPAGQVYSLYRRGKLVRVLQQDAIRFAPASIAFSTSSFNALAGLSTTSPAAIRLTRCSGRRRIDMGVTLAQATASRDR